MENSNCLKYLYEDIYLTEIPGEISLGISLMGCDIRCEGCHSQVLWGTKGGKCLDSEKLKSLIDRHKLMSCILFYGGEWDWEELKDRIIQSRDLGYAVALYSGRDLEWFNKNHPEYKTILDYIKVGNYSKELGGLKDPTTNQRLYRIKDGELTDMTSIFWSTL